MGKYNSGEKKKGKRGNYLRYRENDKIVALHGLYKEQKDYSNDVRDDDNVDEDWYDMEEKEREEDNDDDNDVVDITAVQIFGMPDEAFIGKETNNNKKKEEEKSEGDENDGRKNSGGGAKRENDMRGDIDRSTSKGDNEDDTDLWDKHDFDVERKEGEEWETKKGTITMT